MPRIVPIIRAPCSKDFPELPQEHEPHETAHSLPCAVVTTRFRNQHVRVELKSAWTLNTALASSTCRRQPGSPCFFLGAMCLQSGWKLYRSSSIHIQSSAPSSQSLRLEGTQRGDQAPMALPNLPKNPRRHPTAYVGFCIWSFYSFLGYLEAQAEGSKKCVQVLVTHTIS